MRVVSLWALGALGLGLLCACGNGTPPPALSYYSTCGDPVCKGHQSMAGVPDCTTEKAGATCTTAGQRCDPKNDCNSHLICASSDPKAGPGGCPISNRDKKTDIASTTGADAERALATVRLLPLSTYRYKPAVGKTPGRRHLGFVIEDLPPEAKQLLVDEERGVVDLYSYASLAILSQKAQAAQIEALQKEVAELRALLAKTRNDRATLRSVRRP